MVQYITRVPIILIKQDEHAPVPMVALFAHCITAQAGIGALYGALCCLCVVLCLQAVILREEGEIQGKAGVSYVDSEHRNNKASFSSENLVPVEREAFHNLSFLH